MTVEFENTKADVIKYFEYLGPKSAPKLLYFFVYIGAIISFFTGLVALLIFIRSLDFGSFLSAIFSLTIAFFGFRITQFNARVASNSGSGRTLTGHLKYSATDNGLVAVSEFSNSTIFWSGIEKVIETKEFFAFHFSSAQAFFIPKRAFTSPQQGIEFLRLVEKYRTEATGTPIPETTKGAWWTQSGVMEAETVQKAGWS